MPHPTDLAEQLAEATTSYGSNRRAAQRGREALTACRHNLSDDLHGRAAALIRDVLHAVADIDGRATAEECAADAVERFNFQRNDEEHDTPERHLALVQNAWEQLNLGEPLVVDANHVDAHWTEVEEAVLASWPGDGVTDARRDAAVAARMAVAIAAVAGLIQPVPQPVPLRAEP